MIRRISTVLLVLCAVSAFSLDYDSGSWGFPLSQGLPRSLSLTRTGPWLSGIDAALFVNWPGVDPTGSGVAAAIYGDLTTTGSSAGVGHTIGVLGLVREGVGNQQYTYGVEGRVNGTSQAGAPFSVGALGLAQWASDAATGTLHNIIGVQARSEIYQADQSTPRSTGTAVGIYISPTVGGATKYGLYQAGASDLNYLVGLTWLTTGGLLSSSNILGPIQTAQTIAGGDTITANACGGIKLITSGGVVTTNLTNTFTAPGASNTGCIMHVINTGASNITLDANANNDFSADRVLAPGNKITVASTGSKWYGMTAVVVP